MSGNPLSFGEEQRTHRNNRRLVLTALALVVLWEAAAQFVQVRTERPDQVLPSLSHVVGAFPGLTDYWKGGFGVEAVQFGGERTNLGALLAIVSNGFITGFRLVLGLTLSLIIGGGAGLLIGYIPAVRRFAFGPLNFLGVLPTLAMVPLFAFWFGPTTTGAVAFIVFGAGITILRTTLNAVENVPMIFVEAGQTLGADRWTIYRTVIVPAILPELRAGVRIALTFSWSLALGAEFIGVQDGLGRMMVLAMRFSLVDRMVLIAAVFVILAASTVIMYERLADRLIQWAE